MPRTFPCKDGCCTVELEHCGPHLIRRRRGHLRKAGVFIYDPVEERVLLVQSRGQLWGAPKGTLELDRDENSCECALREVLEETGLRLRPEQFARATKIKNRATYYYVEIPYQPVHIQRDHSDNDANGITWIKVSCLEKYIQSGEIVLNEHCRTLFKRFLDKTFPKSDFTKITRKKKSTSKPVS